MNFQALAPKCYKRGVVSGFVHRIYRACSTWENFHTSLNKAKEILEKNQYPPPFYEDVIAKTLEKIVGPQEHNEQIRQVDTLPLNLLNTGRIQMDLLSNTWKNAKSELKS